MQYAVIEIQGRMLLIAANELQSLEAFGNTITDQNKIDEEQHPYTICYGSYMPQPDIDEKQAMEHFNSSIDSWIGYIDEDKCHLIDFHDAQPMEPEHRGLLTFIPFAALIQTHPEIIEKIGKKSQAQAVTGFLRFDEMSPATNILNRPGIIALKGVERRIKGEPVNKANWHKHIDWDRAMRTARTIK